MLRLTFHASSMRSTYPQTPLRARLSQPRAIRGSPRPANCQNRRLKLSTIRGALQKVVCGWVGLDSRIFLHQGSALALPFADGIFDRAYMLHVGMNIDDKAKLCSEVGRVLRANSLFGIYDV